jgi:exodeoxyribonuclease VII small subunit
VGAANENSNAGNSAAPASFELALERLNVIVHDLEEGQVGLAESLARYEEGIKLLKQCYELLESAERRIELCTGLDADGNPITETFDDSAATASLEEKAQARGRRRSQAAKSPRSTKAADQASAADSDDDGGNDIDSARGLF